MNTTEFLTIACAIVPDSRAMVFEDKRFTYRTSRRGPTAWQRTVRLGCGAGRQGSHSSGEL